ncbi:B3/B4 domain-containing protein [Marinifilum flexuosum]|uniref:DNA/RNA-binding domain of Phe-tRNA-synthetase-like protein n=1 Tax=Marinifilum flexuosum TaxID=1117708 RepID=A0A419X2P9_9BACT|nr:phenylalanine--tRNA ligase beta subunit-related protein [Marinifilum flexuosum]RKE02005.1 DNA/RNA-binding domain of Phe-tRNA-synthetase-like protein [Marinifilum flexuosum]
MINILIEEKLKSTWPDLKLGAIQCDVETQEDCPELWKEINEFIERKEKELDPEKIRQLPSVKSTKLGYRKIGKDPSRYRPSAEALLRRVASGKGLYKINNVVDLLNLVSIDSGFSIGGYNAAKINGDIQLGIGRKDEPYKGIGRGELNIEFLPIFRDELGAFGSPTSDSVRTSITNECSQFLMIILSFQGNHELQKAMDFAVSLLQKHAKGDKVETRII